MKTSFFIVSFLLLNTLSLHADPGLVEKVEIASFDKAPLKFLYGSWSEEMTQTENGIEISGNATAKGGGGTSQKLDLSEVYGLSITLKVLPENKASGVNVILYSDDGHASGYAFSLLEAPGHATTMVVALNKPFFQPGNAPNGPVDLSAITSFQIQGNYKDSAALAVEFQRLEGVPPKN